MPSMFVSRTEITFAHWEACVRGGGCRSNPTPRDGEWGRDFHPVIFVSWSDAHEYTAWLSQTTGDTYRLPTEAEWEYAAGTFPDARPNGEIEPSGNYAWTLYNANMMTHPVGRKIANENGLFDMWGNVWEWVEDCFTPRCNRRVLRGGSFMYAPRQLRSNSRNANDPDHGYNQVGFRVVRSEP